MVSFWPSTLVSIHFCVFAWQIELSCENKNRIVSVKTAHKIKRIVQYLNTFWPSVPTIYTCMYFLCTTTFCPRCASLVQKLPYIVPHYAYSLLFYTPYSLLYILPSTWPLVFHATPIFCLLFCPFQMICPLLGPILDLD